jgi:hypothetical protein
MALVVKLTSAHPQLQSIVSAGMLRLHYLNSVLWSFAFGYFLTEGIELCAKHCRPQAALVEIRDA